MATHMDALSSSEAFVRALKSPNDPPTASGPHKIELAARAWVTEDLYIPGKGELIAEWVLSRLLKEQNNTSVILEPRYWALLSAICDSYGPDPSRLHAVLSRVPSLPIFTRLFDSLAHARPPTHAFFDAVTRVFKSVSSLAVPRAGPDVLLDCLRGVLRCLAAWPGSQVYGHGSEPQIDHNALPQLAALVLESLLRGFQTIPNKKRCLTAFLQDSVTTWATLVDKGRDPLHSFHVLEDVLNDLLRQILFNAETLRYWTDDSKIWNDIFDKMKITEQNAASLRAMPILVGSFVSSLRRYSSVLPSTSGSVKRVEIIRHSSAPVIRHALTLLRTQTSCDAWRSRLEIISLIYSEQLYGSKDNEWLSVMDEEIRTATAHLETYCLGSDFPSCLEALCIIEQVLQLDQSVVEKYLGPLLASCVGMDPDINDSFERILHRLLDFYSKTRSLQVFIFKICDVLHSIRTDGSMQRDLCRAFTAGPLFSTSWEKSFAIAISNFLPFGQVLNVLRHVNLLAMADFGEQEAVSHPAARPAAKRHKRSASIIERKDSGNDARCLLLSQYATFLHSVFLSWNNPEETLVVATTQLRQLIQGLLQQTGLATTLDEDGVMPLVTSELRAEAILKILRLGYRTKVLPSSDHEAKRLFSWIMAILSAPETGANLWFESFRLMLAVSPTKGYPTVFEVHQQVIVDSFLSRMSPPPNRTGFVERGTNVAAKSAHAFPPALLAQGMEFVNACGTDCQIRRAAEIIAQFVAHDTLIDTTLLNSAFFWEHARLQGELRPLVLGEGGEQTHNIAVPCPFPQLTSRSPERGQAVGKTSRHISDSMLQQLSHEVELGCSNAAMRATLQLVAKRCKDPMPLSFSNIGHIWIIVAASLRPSTFHDPEPEIFSNVVAILNALVRLQRAVIVDSLPLLAQSMSALLLTLRTSRPSLGMRQRRQITDAQPFWITQENALSTKHATELARLFCNVIVRTPIYTHGRTPVKLESLSKPFARHAASLLRTYLDMSTDPFAQVAPELRRALQPGLFALCSMISEEDRDALMLSLARSTSQALFKVLWQDYEKQRYSGKG